MQNLTEDSIQRLRILENKLGRRLMAWEIDKNFGINAQNKPIWKENEDFEVTCFDYSNE